MTHPSGIAEVLLGEVTETHFGLLVLLRAGSDARSGWAGPAESRVVLAPTAKQVDATERRISVDGDTMRYEVAMAAVGEPMCPHLEATLTRTH